MAPTPTRFVPVVFRGSKPDASNCLLAPCHGHHALEANRPTHAFQGTAAAAAFSFENDAPWHQFFKEEEFVGGPLPVTSRTTI